METFVQNKILKNLGLRSIKTNFWISGLKSVNLTLLEAIKRFLNFLTWFHL